MPRYAAEVRREVGAVYSGHLSDVEVDAIVDHVLAYSGSERFAALLTAFVQAQRTWWGVGRG